MNMAGAFDTPMTPSHAFPSYASSHAPSHASGHAPSHAPSYGAGYGSVNAGGPSSAGYGEKLLPLGELERRHITHALALTGGHLARAAELLGIHRNTLRRKLQEYGLGPTSDERASGAGIDVEVVVVADAVESRRDWSALGSSIVDLLPLMPQADRGPSLARACSAA
jgi:hypothetical protein